MNAPKQWAYGIPRIIYCAVVSAAIMSQAAFAQTLNDAVTAQLAAADSLPCPLLLAGDPASVLGSGGLNAICTRAIIVIGDGVPSSTAGGGAATPPSAPSVIEARLKEESDDEYAIQAKRGFFFTIGYDSVDRDVSQFEEGYGSDVLRLGAGFDWAVGNSWILGIAADGSEQDGDFDDFGDFSIRTLGLTGFGSYLFGDTGSFDFYAGYSSQSNDRLRQSKFTEIQDPTSPFEVIGTPTADFDADQVLAGVQFSYDWAWDTVTLGPRLGYYWSQTDYETYSEIDSSGLALTFHDDEETSSLFSAGLAASAAVSTKFGAVLFGGSVLYKHDSDQDQRDVEIGFVEDTRARRFTYQTEIPDQDYIDFFAGSTFILPNGLQIFLVYRGTTSHDYLDVSAGTFGIRKEF